MSSVRSWHCDLCIKYGFTFLSQRARVDTPGPLRKRSPRSMTVRVLYYLSGALVGRSRLACLALVSGRRRLARRRSFVWRRLESSTSCFIDFESRAPR